MRNSKNTLAKILGERSVGAGIALGFATLLFSACIQRSVSVSSTRSIQLVTVPALVETDPSQSPESRKLVELPTYNKMDLGNDSVASVVIDGKSLKPMPDGTFVFSTQQPDFNAVQTYYWITKAGQYYAPIFKSAGMDTWRAQDANGQEVVREGLPRVNVCFVSMIPWFLGFGSIDGNCGAENLPKALQGSLTFGISRKTSADITVIVHEYGHILKALAEVAGLQRSGVKLALGQLQEQIDKRIRDKSFYQMIDEAYADFLSLSFLDYRFFGKHSLPLWTQDISEDKSFPQHLVSQKSSCLQTNAIMRGLDGFGASPQFSGEVCNKESDVAVDARFSSRIFSSLFWDLRQDLGRDEAAKLLLTAAAINPSIDNPVALLKAVEGADDALNHGAHKAIIRKNFLLHGIGPDLKLARLNPTGGVSFSLQEVPKSRGEYTAGVAVLAPEGSFKNARIVFSSGIDMSPGTVELLEIQTAEGKVKFGSPIPLPGNDYFTRTAVGDFNHDGLKDLLVTRYISGRDDLADGKVALEPARPGIFLATGSGSFVQSDFPFVSPLHCFSAELVDFNRDGFLDASFSCGDIYTNSKESVQIFLNSGGRFNSSPVWTSPPYISYDHKWGDLNNDGFLDLVVSTQDSGVLVFLNNKQGGIQAPLVLPGLKGNQIALGDVDGDGLIDLAVSQNPGPFLIFKNQFQAGQLKFGKVWESKPDVLSSFLGSVVKLQDLNGDGRLDLLIGEWKGYLRVYMNQGGMIGADPAWISENRETVQDVAFSDFNRDGKVDFVVAVFDIDKPNKVYLRR